MQRDDTVDGCISMLSKASRNAHVDRSEYSGVSLALVRECAEDLGGVVLVLLPQLVEQAHVLERGVAALAVEGDHGVRGVSQDHHALLPVVRLALQSVGEFRIRT